MILLDFAGQIKGDSQVEEHTDWITVESVQFGVGRSVSMSGGGKDRETSNPSFSEITFSKTTDISSADLFYQSVQGKALGNATIHFIQTGGTDSSQAYMKVTLVDAIVSSYSVSSGGDRPSESISVNFTKIEFQYDAFDGSKITTGTPKKWDLMGNKSY